MISQSVDQTITTRARLNFTNSVQNVRVSTVLGFFIQRLGVAYISEHEAVYIRIAFELCNKICALEPTIEVGVPGMEIIGNKKPALGRQNNQAAVNLKMVGGCRP